MLVDLYLINNVRGHLQAVLQFTKRWQEHLFDNLQVAEVAHGQIVHHQHNLLWQRLQLI